MFISRVDRLRREREDREGSHDIKLVTTGDRVSRIIGEVGGENREEKYENREERSGGDQHAWG